MKYLGTIQNDKDLVTKEYTDNLVSQKQDTLISGTNIKTINEVPILGPGNIDPSEIGMNDHVRLINRDAANAHPISAITSLESELDARPDDALTNLEIYNIMS